VAKLVKYGGSQDLKCKGSVNKRVYSTSPTILIEWMEQSIIDSGFRLLSHACWHAMDNKETSLLEASGKICEYDGEMCISIVTKM
jgi:hypothetical protein